MLRIRDSVVRREFSGRPPAMPIDGVSRQAWFHDQASSFEAWVGLPPGPMVVIDRGPEPQMPPNVRHWLQGDRTQNFGDFLSEFFMERLFFGAGLLAPDIRIVGSCIDDGLLHNEAAPAHPIPMADRKTVFWGCGLRHEHSLSDSNRDEVEILAVRGPLSRSALRLGETVPMGDPGLLLPALHKPAVSPRAAGIKIIVPHFHDKRSDGELLNLTGCTSVLRPNIPHSIAGIEDFLDRLVEADFVLSASLHAAIAAAAYGLPFAFWDSGAVDLPFKWHDFAASISIPCVFQASLSDAQDHYDQHIRPSLSIPVLWPLLAVAPFPVRPEAFVRVIAGDIDRHGLAALRTPAPSRVSCMVHADIAKNAALPGQLQSALDLAAAQLSGIQVIADTLKDSQDALLQERDNLLAALITAEQDKIRAEQGRLEAEQGRSEAEQKRIRAEQDRAAAEEQAAREVEAKNAVIYSTGWRLLAPVRAAGRRYPRLLRSFGRVAKILWWTITLQIGYRYMLYYRHRAALKAEKNPAADMPHQSDAITPWDIPDVPPPESEPPAIEQGEPPEIEQNAAPVAQPAPSIPDLIEAFIAWHGHAAIHFPPVVAPEVSIIIPGYRGLFDLETCLRSISVHRATEPCFEVIVVDDCPAESVIWAIPYSGGLIRVLNEQQLGFVASCNRGVAAARGRILCFVDSETIVTSGWLRPLIEALNDMPASALSGGMLLDADGTIQSAGLCILGSGLGYPAGSGAKPNDGRYTYRRPVDSVSGACFAIARTVWDKLDGLDPLYGSADYRQLDLALRARLEGLCVVYEPRSRVVRLGAGSHEATCQDELSRSDQARFCERFAELLLNQPRDTGDEFGVRRTRDDGPVLLVVDLGLPQPDRHAGDVTISKYLEILATAGWSLVFAPMDERADGPAAEALERQGIEIIRRPNTLEDWLSNYGKQVDAVWLSRPEISEGLIEKIRSSTTAYISYYTHDLHHVRLQQEADLVGDEARGVEAARVKALECAVFESVDHVMSPSAEEAEVIRQLAPGTPVTVLPPYYYDFPDIHSHGAEHFATLSDIVFVGGFPHTPNVDAALFIANSVMPIVWEARPDARLVLVGYGPPPEILALAGSRIVVTGQVPDVQPFLDKARLLLGALRFGAGVKGKTVEALRCGLPAVLTPIAAEGIGIDPGRDAIVAHDAAGLARGVLELLQDPDGCAAISSAGAELIRRRFSRAAARAAVSEVFRQPRCAICGSGRLLAPPESGTISRAVVCGGCFALGRSEALARIAVARLARGGEESLTELARRKPDFRVHQFGGGAIADTLRGQPWFSVSDYYDELPPGADDPGEVRHETPTRPTDVDASLDLVISQDVMEHVPDPAVACARIARMLRPGGSHIFTIEQPADRLESDLIATLRQVDLRLIGHDVPVAGAAPQQRLRVFEALKDTEFASRMACASVGGLAPA